MRRSLFVLFCIATTFGFANPPEPPEGFTWEKNDSFSDEFNGDSLDQSKWLDHHPYWRGRPPAKFVPQAISVSDGMLMIRNSMLEKPTKKFTIAGGAVCSKSDQAFFGYYEARLKASNVSMSTTFWMSNRPRRTKAGRVSEELDIVEAIGAPKRDPKWNRLWKSNTHIFQSFGRKTKDYAVGDEVAMDPPQGEVFHTYAAWWVDAKTVKYYLDDVHVMTVTPSTELSPKPFSRPMQINMVTETYDWETPPTPEELADDTINTSYYDWVRSYRLVKIGEEKKSKKK